MDRATRKLLAHKAYQLRVDSIRSTTAAGSGHPSSCLSAADLLAVIFFHAMRYNPQNPRQVNNDRFVLSKGHAAPLLYAVFKQLGIISDEQLLTLRQIDSVLEGHPTFRFYHAEAATGSLGCGLSIGLGIALANRLNGVACYTYVLLGDSECSEGSVWEAAEIAAYYKANKLIAVIDVNRLGQTGQTIHGHETQRYCEKFRAFGWHVLEVDGHDIAKIAKVIQQAQYNTERPTVVIAKTFKGYGISRIENSPDFHGKVFSQDELQEVLNVLASRFSTEASYEGDGWEPQLPERADEQPVCSDFSLPMPDISEKIATRVAYGKAIAVAGSVCETVVSLDAEVKNSTFAELFENEHPHRFFQCFVAEQNMVGMGIGFSTRKKVPFIATFAAFFTRAFDQIRMAAIGKNPLRLAGSHVGVSIGEDGPSQMGLEDIAMMRALPGSIVLYPCDGHSTFKLVELMANYHEGISYIRLTREPTSLIYRNNEKFVIGGSHLLCHPPDSQVLIVAAGITVHEALQAAQILEEQAIAVSVLDLYSIKPLDTNTLLKAAHQASNRVITVEDHYLEGGMGQAVCAALANTDVQLETLAVGGLPRSGKPKELRAWASIDASALVKCVKALIDNKISV